MTGNLLSVEETKRKKKWSLFQRSYSLMVSNMQTNIIIELSIKYENTEEGMPASALVN